MPIFVYEAVSESGRKMKGSVNALSKQTAIVELREQGLNIHSIKEKAASLFDKEIIIGRAVKLDDFVIFCRQFATLIRSGVQIDRALDILEDQTTAKFLKRALGEVSLQIKSGLSLSKAMGDHPKVFPEMFVNMIASGETAGNLDDVLLRMADHYEKEYKTVQKVKSAMTYPIIVLIITVLVVIFLLVKIVPTFAAMFQEQGAELPLVTRIVMGASHMIAAYWWVLLMLTIGTVLIARMWMGTDEGRLSIDRMKYRIPIFGLIMKKAAIARLTRTLSSLFISAVPVLQALQVAERVVGNRLLAGVLAEARDSLQQGNLLSEPFGKSGIFPKMVIQMLNIGEETGQVDQMLEKIADFYEADVDQSVDRIKAIIEPLMLLVVSGIVGLIVASIMTPMFKMYQNFLN